MEVWHDHDLSFDVREVGRVVHELIGLNTQSTKGSQ